MNTKCVTIVPSGEGRTFWVDGHPVTCKIVSEQTGGAFSVCEMAVPPGGGLPSHIHSAMGETTYVLDGTFEFVLEERVVTGRAGFCVHVPHGVCHSLVNAGTVWGRLLSISAPGGMEEMFRAVSGLRPEAESAGALSFIYAQYGQEMREPSPAEKPRPDAQEEAPEREP